MSAASGGWGVWAGPTGERIQEWSVVAVGLLLGAQPLLLVGFGSEIGPVTMSPPLLAAGGIAVAGGWLRRMEYTPEDLLVVATWVAVAAMVFAVVIAISVFAIFEGSVVLGATATAFMTPIGAGAGLLAGYSDARRRREYRRGRRTRVALEETTDGVAIVDDDGFTAVNRAYAEMHGYDDPEAMAGRSWETCYPDHERRRLEAEAMPRLTAGEAWRGEATGQRADGGTFPQELTLTPIADGGRVCIVRDISDRRERERRLRRQTRRLRTVVENAPIVLFAVDGEGKILFMEGQGLSRLGAGPADLEGRDREFAETIVEWCDDIAGLLDRVETVLATLSDGGGVDLEVVDAAAIVREEFARLERTYPEVTFESDLPATVPVRADDVLADVVRNVATNAVRHNDAEGLVVSASAAVGEDRATIRIADNGTGIPPDRQEAVFGRGESSMDSAGSGFGLFFVDAMVDAYDGDVRVENDDGAVFVIELPSGAADAETTAPARGDPP